MRRPDVGTVGLFLAALLALLFVWFLATHPER
jgi:hypothetical protein